MAVTGQIEPYRLYRVIESLLIVDFFSLPNSYDYQRLSLSEYDGMLLVQSGVPIFSTAYTLRLKFGDRDHEVSFVAEDYRVPYGLPVAATQIINLAKGLGFQEQW